MARTAEELQAFVKSMMPILGVCYHRAGSEADAKAFYKEARRQAKAKARQHSITMFEEAGQWTVRVSNW